MSDEALRTDEPDAGRGGAPRRPPYAPRSAARPADTAADTAALRERAAAVNRGAARAAVLGVNDGLVTNICLILAIAGASASASDVRLAGLASLIAGAFSMAAGEWISVRSQVELYEGVVGELRRLTERNPRLAVRELTDRLVDQGFAADTAGRVATELPLDAEHFLDFSSRTMFGVDRGELGSPWVAAGSSLGLFAVGAIVPLAPWFWTEGGAAITLSFLATVTASVLVGAWVARSADRPPWVGGLRQLAIVVAASAVTYGIGSLFGTTVA